MKQSVENKPQFKHGDRVLIDIWASYSEQINPTVPGTIMDVTKTQYYVCPDWLSPQYVHHHCVIAEPKTTKPLYYLTYPADDSGNDDGILAKRRMTYEEAVRCNQQLEGTGKQWVR